MSSLGLLTFVIGSGPIRRSIEHAVIDGVRNPEPIPGFSQRPVEVASGGRDAEVGGLDSVRLQLLQELPVHPRKGDVVVRSMVDREVARDRRAQREQLGRVHPEQDSPRLEPSQGKADLGGKQSLVERNATPRVLKWDADRCQTPDTRRNGREWSEDLAQAPA